jgi:hypothetical protein
MACPLRKYIAIVTAALAIVASALALFTRASSPQDWPSDGLTARDDDDATTTRRDARRRVSRRKT